ncbi:MAG: ABC transporter ATP-binding protein [Lachnospiraceae bacterium]|nr:ABC transporter ATP-binding protein [Dorea sp.]MEE0737495.1 ABC transporter ATP-binding protein [Lachnospiraceae bacterium]
MAAYEEQEYHKPFMLKVWAKMLPFFKSYKKYFAITLGLNIFLAGVDVLTPLFQSYAIDHFIVPDTLEGIGVFAFAYISMIVMQTISVYWSVHAATTIEMCVGKDLKWAQFEHLQTLSFSYYNTTPVGYIHARVMSDTLKIAGVAAWGLVDMFWAFLYVVSVFVIMFALNAQLAVILLVIVPCIAVITVVFQNKILHWNRRVRKINSQITSAYNEGITGVKTSKSMGIEKDNEEAFFERTSDMYRSAGRAAKLNAVYIPTILLFGSAAAAFVLYRGGYMVQQDLIKLGTLSVFISYAVVIFEPIQQLARLLADLISCQANIERVMDLLEQTPDVTDRTDVIEKYGDNFYPKKGNWEKIHGDIVFEDVSFRYPDGKEYVLEHFNLHIPAGMNVAIVGETGAGKSTLVNLVGRFFEPTKGRILIDGVDYRERSQLWLHSQIGYVLQNPHLFSGTVRENIRYGRLDATDEEVEAAARSVSADEIVKKLKDGYDSDVGESGGRLSVGEKQLISFARAILAEPAIFVLDEATSSIDTVSEQLIQEATDKLLKGHTSFVIAHRLSTIRKADLILVVKDGKIIEQGTHAELLGGKGYYHDLYYKQFEEESARKVFAGDM